MNVINGTPNASEVTTWKLTVKKPMSAANIAPFFISQIPDYSMKLYDLLIVDLPEHHDI